jgi:hypothetical protein
MKYARSKACVQIRASETGPTSLRMTPLRTAAQVPHRSGQGTHLFLPSKSERNPKTRPCRDYDGCEARCSASHCSLIQPRWACDMPGCRAFTSIAVAAKVMRTPRIVSLYVHPNAAFVRNHPLKSPTSCLCRHFAHVSWVPEPAFSHSTMSARAHLDLSAATRISHTRARLFLAVVTGKVTVVV